MKKNEKAAKLVLSRKTVRELNPGEMQQAAGGFWTYDTSYWCSGWCLTADCHVGTVGGTTDSCALTDCSGTVTCNCA